MDRPARLGRRHRQRAIAREPVTAVAARVGRQRDRRRRRRDRVQREAERRRRTGIARRIDLADLDRVGALDRREQTGPRRAVIDRVLDRPARLGRRHRQRAIAREPVTAVAARVGRQRDRRRRRRNRVHRHMESRRGNAVIVRGVCRFCRQGMRPVTKR